MVKQKSGLIVNVSYHGRRHYFNNVAFGLNKAAIDRLFADSAMKLKPHGVSVISLNPDNASS